tara:strand:+ start:8328 stop:9182 length:855 start_codon:yes stop_codon:yes gene_type:complete
VPEFLASTTGSALDSIWRTLPVSSNSTSAGSIPDMGAVTLKNPYVAILGHEETTIRLSNASAIDGGIINGGYIAGDDVQVKAGFGIAKLDQMPTGIGFWPSGSPPTALAGSILLGTFFDFPHAVDLKTTLSYSYEGIKETTTKGGATLTNKFYSGPPKWGNGLGAWELGGTAAYAKSGRRIWDISWSFLSEADIWPDNAGLVNEDDNDTETLTLLHDDTIQRCIHLCGGSELPFIFQYDNEITDGFGTPAPHSFAIAKFDMKKFSFQQTAPGLYSCKIRVKEVW